MSVRVKICGITSLEDARFAVGAGADALGFNFYPKSTRYVAPGKVAEIVSSLPPFVTAVGVFVNESTQQIVSVIDTACLQAVQLHGDEPPEACEGLPASVIKAFRVGPEFEVGMLDGWPVDTVLLDTARAGSYGGTGETFDWSLAVAAASGHRIILSGGLNPENVTEAVRTVGPYAVDAASGVEVSPGVKDPEKVAAFIKAAKELL